ncbi:MAG: hypothetical protein LBE27_02740 [Deltaproteobacteria bacterium]|jgi:hypothetical protein|nr:hypothetical protein [Deltaproteobacteria bacterium]
MTEIKRRKAQDRTPKEPAPEKAVPTPRKNKLSDYDKADTPYGTVYYKRPEDGPKPQRKAPKHNPRTREGTSKNQDFKKNSRSGGHKPPTQDKRRRPMEGGAPPRGRRDFGFHNDSGRGPSRGPNRAPGRGPNRAPIQGANHGPSRGHGRYGDHNSAPRVLQINFTELDVALDRELPVTMERLLEAKQLLSESAAKILDLSESLQNCFLNVNRELLELDLEEDKKEIINELLSAYSRNFTETVTKLFEAASFDDLCGQRLTKVHGSIGTVNELLKDIKKRLSPAPKKEMGPKRGGPSDFKKPAKFQGERKSPKDLRRAAGKKDKSAFSKKDQKEEAMEKAAKAPKEEPAPPKSPKKLKKASKEAITLQGPTLGGMTQEEIEKLFEEEKQNS